MKKNILAVQAFLAVFLLASGVNHAQTCAMKQKVSTFDVNKDGKLDVTYYQDEKGITRVEADTNYDGKKDVTIYTKAGKFESAEVDTDYDGKTDKTINDTEAFNKWLNQDKPDFSPYLRVKNGMVTLYEAKF